MQDLWSAKSSSNTLVLEEARATGKVFDLHKTFSLQLSKGIDWRKVGCGFWIGSLCRTMRPSTFLTFGSDNLTLKFDRGETYLQCRNDQACHPLLIWPLGKGWNRILKNTRQWAMNVILEGKRKHITRSSYINNIGSCRKPPCIIFVVGIWNTSQLRWWGTSQHPRTGGEVVCCFVESLGNIRIWKQILSQDLNM